MAVYNYHTSMSQVVVPFSSGNISVEDAVGWIVDHENDPDIDQMPLVCAFYPFFYDYYILWIMIFIF